MCIARNFTSNASTGGGNGSIKTVNEISEQEKQKTEENMECEALRGGSWLVECDGSCVSMP